MDIGSNNRAIRRAQFPTDTHTAAERARAVRSLWPVLTAHLQAELHAHGRCALVARATADGGQLFVETGEGHLRGAVVDPLGLASRMLARGVGKVACACEADGSTAIEVVLLTLLGEPMDPVGDTGLVGIGDRFVDGVTDGDLPSIEGIEYDRVEVSNADLGRSAGAPPTAGEPLDAAGFAARVRTSRSAVEIVRMLRTLVLPYADPGARGAFVRPLMSAARHHNETRDDVRSAITLWSEAHALGGVAGDPAAVIAIMMHVARKRGSADLPPAQRDVAGAVRIYEAVYALGCADDQLLRVRKTMMAVANRFTDLSLPASQRDVAGAVQLWAAILDMELPAGERGFVVRSMMKIANLLTDLRGGRRPEDVGGAIAIWRAVCDHARDDDDWERAIRTMMALANRLTDPARPPSMEDFGDAVRVWRAAYALCLERDEDQPLRVVRTMMDVANHLTDFSAAVDDRSLRGAIEIWRGVVASSALTEDRDRAIRTMMKLAGARIGAYSDRDGVRAALRLWHASFGCADSDDGRLRVVKTIMDLANRYPAICAHALDLLRHDRAAFDAPGFADDVLAGLLYYQREYAAVLALAEHAGHGRTPAVDALRAEALRKLGRHADAIAACDALLRRDPSEGRGRGADHDRGAGRGRADDEARVAALCCRGYARLELGRDDPRHLDTAAADLRSALDAAARSDVPEPPRAHTGIGYVRELQGRTADAEAAFARARVIDADNRKAADGPAASAPADRAAEDDSPTLRRKRALMNEARRRNELHDDVEGAISCWADAHAIRIPGDDPAAVVAIMMAVARKRASSDLAPEHRDVPGAVRIYEAVRGLHLSPDQDQRVVRNMMATAARFSDPELSPERRDIDGAIALWRSVAQLADGDAIEHRRVARTMEVVAAKIEARAKDRPHADQAAAIRLLLESS